jgi:hypothetical protein
MRVVAAFYGPIYFGDFAQTGSSFEPWVALSNTEAVDPYSMANPHASSPDCQRVTRT